MHCFNYCIFSRYFYDICQLCNKIFVNFKEYVDHLQREHSKDETEEIICNICGKSVLLSQLENHYKLEHPLGSLFICETCNLSFEMLEELEKHNDDVHEPLVGFSWDPVTSKFLCNFCIKSFKTKGGASKHVRVVHKPEFNSQLQVNIFGIRYILDKPFVSSNWNV